MDSISCCCNIIPYLIARFPASDFAIPIFRFASKLVASLLPLFVIVTEKLIELPISGLGLDTFR